MAITLADIQTMIEDSAQEGLQLEFKHGAELLRRPEHRDRQDAEFIKDVTGFANAEGGVLIYGINEQEQDGIKVAAALAPVPDGSLSVEALSQKLRALSAPPITNVQITEIRTPDGGKIVVLEIPTGATAHQNLKDCRYYQRGPRSVEWMVDFQIRDVMGRRTQPLATVKLEISRLRQLNDMHVYGTRISIENIGSVLLERWLLEVDYPSEVIANGGDLAHFGGEFPQKLCTVDGHSFFRIAVADPLQGRPPMFLHPGRSIDLDSIGFPQIRLQVDDAIFRLLSVRRPPIRWRLFRLDANPLTGEIPFETWCNY